MSTTKTKSLSRQRAAVQRIKKATWDYHREVRRLDRDTSVYSQERSTLLAEARQKADAEVTAAKQAFTEGMTADRAEHTRYVDAPTGQELSQRLYWQQAATADLAGLGGDAAAALIGNLVQQGATAQAREYLRAARPVLPGLDYGRLDRATMPPEAKAADAWGTALDTYEEATVGSGWLNRHVEQVMHTAATITPDERSGAVAPSESYDDRVLDLMLERAEGEAVQAFTQRVQYLEDGDQ